MSTYDLIIRGGTIVDGLRTPRYVGDIAVKDGVIAKVDGLKNSDAKETLEASGLIVAPRLRRPPHSLRRPDSMGPVLLSFRLAWCHVGSYR